MSHGDNRQPLYVGPANATTSDAGGAVPKKKKLTPEEIAAANISLQRDSMNYQNQYRLSDLNLRREDIAARRDQFQAEQNRLGQTARLNAISGAVTSGHMNPDELKNYLQGGGQQPGAGGAIRRQAPDMNEVRRQRLQQEIQFEQSNRRYAQTHPGTKQGASFQATPGGPTIEFSGQQAGDAGTLAGGIRGAYEAYKGQAAIRAMKAAQLADQVQAQQAMQPQSAQQPAQPINPDNVQVDPGTGNAKGYDPALDNFRNSGGTTKMAYAETPDQYAGRAAREANPSLYPTQAEQYFRDNPPQTPQPAQGSPAQVPQAQQAPASTDDFTNLSKMAENKLKQLQAAVPGSPEARSLRVQLDMLRGAQGKYAELQPQQVQPQAAQSQAIIPGGALPPGVTHGQQTDRTQSPAMQAAQDRQYAGQPAEAPQAGQAQPQRLPATGALAPEQFGYQVSLNAMPAIQQQSPEDAHQQYMDTLNSDIDYWTKQFQAAGGTMPGEKPAAAQPNAWEQGQQLKLDEARARTQSLLGTTPGQVAEQKRQAAADARLQDLHEIAKAGQLTPAQRQEMYDLNAGEIRARVSAKLGTSPGQVSERAIKQQEVGASAGLKNAQTGVVTSQGASTPGSQAVAGASAATVDLDAALPGGTNSFADAAIGSDQALLQIRSALTSKNTEDRRAAAATLIPKIAAYKQQVLKMVKGSTSSRVWNIVKSAWPGPGMVGNLTDMPSVPQNVARLVANAVAMEAALNAATSTGATPTTQPSK